MEVLIFWGVLALLLVANRYRKIDESKKSEKILKVVLFVLGLLMAAVMVGGTIYGVRMMAELDTPPQGPPRNLPK